jgi:hypothetical protein
LSEFSYCLNPLVGGVIRSYTASIAY